MNEKLKSYWEKGSTAVKTTVSKVSKKVWIIAAVVLVVAAAAIAIYLNTRPYVTLITGSSTEEISAVLSWLDERGYKDYRLEGGDTILVPSSQESTLRAGMIMAGYPKTGYSYEYYTSHVGMMSTESERNRAFQIDLQEKLASDISSLNGIESATVTITLGEDNSYVLDRNNVVNATAAVIVHIPQGEVLSSDMVTAIRNYVSHSVQGLEFSSVSIMDGWGNGYGDTSSLNGSDLSALNFQMQEYRANIIRTQVYQMLSSMYGEGNFNIAVNVIGSISNKVIDDYQVGLPGYAQDGSTNGQGIIGSLSYAYTYYTDENTNAGGVVGTTPNSDLMDPDLSTYVEQEPNPADYPDRVSGEGQKVFDNSKTQTHEVVNYFVVDDVTVAVTVNSTTAGPVDQGALRSLVASAAGIIGIETEEMTSEEYLASRITIYSTPFFVSGDTPVPGPDGESILPGIPNWVLIAAAAGLLFFLILLIVILMLRGKKKKKEKLLALQKEQEEAEAAQLVAIISGEDSALEPTGADVMSLQTERSMELRQDIRQFAEENPEVAAQLLKAWLRGGEDDG